jgi:hypothetical protein
MTINGQVTPMWQAWFAQVSSSSSGSAGDNYPTFDAGMVQWAGPNGSFNASIQMIFGNKLPNPSGVIGPALLLGSGFGATGQGSGGSFWIITDQAYLTGTPGNNLGITAGETQPSGSAPGGQLWTLGGGSYGGYGGEWLGQGGSSLHGPGGPAVLTGGNSTFGKPGDAFVSGGQAGTQGANVHLIATYLNNAQGVIRHRMNSDIMMDEIPLPATASGGSVGFELYIYGGGGYGTAGQSLKSGGPGAAVYWG